jgi:hypothetical protein
LLPRRDSSTNATASERILDARSNDLRNINGPASLLCATRANASYRTGAVFPEKTQFDSVTVP